MKVSYYIRNIIVQETHFAANSLEQLIVDTWAMQTFLPIQTELKSGRLKRSSPLFGQVFGEQFEEQGFVVRQL
jgi:hypothetical protein